MTEATAAASATATPQIGQSMLEVHQAGVSIVPIKVGTKQPTVGWKHYQNQIADDETVQHWARNAGAFAIIGGIVSGGLEILDFDVTAGVHFMPLFPDRDQGFDIVGFRAFFDVVVPYGGGATVRQIDGVTCRARRAIHNSVSDNVRYKCAGFDVVA